jgi:hypothetical protein
MKPEQLSIFHKTKLWYIESIISRCDLVSNNRNRNIIKKNYHEIKCIRRQEI